ncbi:STAS domain-containing protein [Nannocystis sp. ILAH1]|uniref:STAS domain-containing protein n=1 Tax=unclassified Nannocystis TaxID=2627009 RepID=UPI00226E392F|nr:MULTISPECIES: STAS domain-containing protein [unclassified Nannocystis]MCY0987688.1 STAS domain-containing protein [Nannocystis sp. ILAH1]MCY1070511.1 STAS domain-containing protein [Nannocystis sp. RBIL2]
MDAGDELDGAPLVVIEVDAAGVITRWNRRAERVFGTARAAAVGQAMAEVLPLATGSWAALASGDDAPRVWPIRRPDGAWWLEACSQRVADGGAVRLYGHEVGARRAAEARAALESTLLAAIQDNLEIVLWAVDERGVFLHQAGKANERAGVPRDFLIGKNIFELYKAQGNGELIARAIAGEPAHTRSAPLYGQYWDTWYIPVRDDRTEARLVGVSLNISEAALAEIELRAKLELVERQQAVIHELATPIIEVWDGVLTLPIVGLVDTARAAELMDALLQAVTRTRARFAILDLTGVEVVDTGTASHLIKMIEAIALLGAAGILTGIRPSIAQTIVGLGVDLSRVVVHAKLRDALASCLRAGRR